jgi:hypothetical protein
MSLSHNNGVFSAEQALTEGPQSFTVSATDIADNTGSTTVGITVSIPPVVHITSPADLSAVSASTISIVGTVDDADATVVILNGIGDTVSASNLSGTFRADLTLREGANILTASATDSFGAIGTETITITRDNTKPHLAIEFPSVNFVSYLPSIDVRGSVNDLVIGTVSGDQVQVVVNGISAQVENRTFLAQAIALTSGENTITATGTDRVGNRVTVSVPVIYDSTAGRTINLVSGDDQSGTVDQILAAPLIVSLTDAAGAPAPNHTVTFQITENNGTILNGTPSGERGIVVMTNAAGLARVRWKLGTRAGAGNNVVEAIAAGFAGKVVFIASGRSDLAAKINMDAGNNQKGAVGQPLPRAFVAIVTDEGHNRLPNVSVVFTVHEGGGNFDGEPSITVVTDSDGRALARSTLGPNAGIENNRVQATILGHAGAPAVFVSSGQAVGDPASTKISGVVFDNSNNPVEGVRIHLENTSSQLDVHTDAHGQFMINSAPVGSVLMVVDGRTAITPGTWPTLEFELVTVSGQNNTVGMPIYLLPLNTQNGLLVDESHGGTMTLSSVPGFELKIAPGSATFPDGSRSGIVSVTVVHTDKVPMTPNFGQQPRFIVTIQPSGVRFNPPAAITFPNLDGLAPGSITELYSFDHDVGSFVAIGTGTVSEDGTVIVSDSGVGIVKGGWHCGGNPATVGVAGVCPECQKCEITGCQPDPGQIGKACSGKETAV